MNSFLACLSTTISPSSHLMSIVYTPNNPNYTTILRDYEGLSYTSTLPTPFAILGASFGVVIAYKLELVRVPPVVTVFLVTKTLEENATDVVHRWQYVADKLDNNLFVRVFIQFKDRHGGVRRIVPRRLRRISPSRELVLDRKTSFRPMAAKVKSDYVKTPIPRDGVDGILKKIARSGEVGLAKAKTDEVREFHDYMMTPFVSENPREAFLNYRDIDIGRTDNGPNTLDEARVYGAKYFKGNFERLVRAKTEIDPGNFFRYEQSIPPNKTVCSFSPDE